MSKYKDIEEFFKKNIDLNINKNLIIKLKNFRLAWVTKNDEQLDFLSGNLLGTNMIKFSILDDEKLMIEVLGLNNYKDLQEDIYNVKGMERNFKIGSNIIYQTLTYIGYRVLKSKDFKGKDEEQALIEICLILQYRLFSSTYNWFFKFKAPERLALTVYNNLNHKFLIKQLDSWDDVFRYRANQCLEKDNSNNKKFKSYTTEDAIRIITNLQTKIRDQIKQIFFVFMYVIENDEVLQQEGDDFMGEDGLQLKSKVGGLTSYISSVQQIMYSPNEFIDNDIIDVVVSLFNNIERDKYIGFLKCMTNDEFSEYTELGSIIEDILSITYTYLQRSEINIEDKSTISEALTSIRFYWSSSKVKNETMVKVKEKLKEKAYKCTHKKTGWFLSGLVLMYSVHVFLLSMKK